MHTIQINPGKYIVKNYYSNDSMYSLFKEYFNTKMKDGIKIALYDDKECIIFYTLSDTITIIKPINDEIDETDIIYSFEALNYVLFISTDVEKKIMYDGNIFIFNDQTLQRGPYHNRCPDTTTRVQPVGSPRL
jgi:hypothetical protein